MCRVICLSSNITNNLISFKQFVVLTKFSFNFFVFCGLKGKCCNISINYDILRNFRDSINSFIIIICLSTPKPKFIAFIHQNSLAISGSFVGEKFKFPGINATQKIKFSKLMEIYKTKKDRVHGRGNEYL